MLDYLSASVAFWMVMFALQEHLLKFRLDEIADYWFLVISCSLFISWLLSGFITIMLVTISPLIASNVVGASQIHK
jgi:hypothetical protein